LDLVGIVLSSIFIAGILSIFAVLAGAVVACFLIRRRKREDPEAGSRFVRLRLSPWEEPARTPELANDKPSIRLNSQSP
jgi:hypothetical protein